MLGLDERGCFLPHFSNYNLDIIREGNECCASTLLLCQPFLVNQLKLLGKYKIKLLALIESQFGRIERSPVRPVGKEADLKLMILRF